MLNPAIKVENESSIQGRCLIADTPIPAGTILFRFDDVKPPVHLYELVDWPPQKRLRFLTYASQIGEDDFSFRQGDIRFINHSCDPTGRWSDYGVLTARRDINPGEEITYDYSTADIKLAYQMKCLCGTKACRGIVTNMDYLNPDFQKRYAGELPDHVLHAIDEAQSGRPAIQMRGTGDIPAHVIEAARHAKLKVPEFRAQLGEDQYIFEVFKYAIHQIRSHDPEFCATLGDKAIFEMVRDLVLGR